MRKHDCGVALYPPPEVGGFTATEDKNLWRGWVKSSKVLSQMTAPHKNFYDREIKSL